MAAILNLANGADRFVLPGIDIKDDALDPSKLLLQSHPGPLTGSHKDGHRQAALAFKDLLDEFNNSGE